MYLRILAFQEPGHSVRIRSGPDTIIPLLCGFQAESCVGASGRGVESARQQRTANPGQYPYLPFELAQDGGGIDG